MVKGIAVLFLKLLESLHFGFRDNQSVLSALQFLNQFTAGLSESLESRLELQVVSSLDQQSVDRNGAETLLLRVLSKHHPFSLDCLGLHVHTANGLVRLAHRCPRFITLPAAKL